MEDNARNYWNIRARSFPGYQADNAYQARILSLMEKHGVNIDGKNVLDLGCGSGAYTIRFASKAKKVVALDQSNGMIENVENSIRQANIHNIECVVCDWEQYEPTENFDLIFASLTPAIDSVIGIEKVLKCATKWVVCISSIQPMDVPLITGLYKIHGIERKPRHRDFVLKKYLDDNSIKYTSFPVSGEWLTQKNYQDTINNCVDIIESRGIEPNMNAIKEYITSFKNTTTGMYESITKYNVEMLILEMP